MWFAYDPQINFLSFFRNLNVVIFLHFDDGSEWTVGTLYAQLLLQFYSDLNLVIFILHFDNESEWTVGTLYAQLLLQFYSDSFETLQMV